MSNENSDIQDAKMLRYLELTGRGAVAKILKTVSPEARELAKNMPLTQTDMHDVRVRLAKAHRKRRGGRTRFAQA